MTPIHIETLINSMPPVWPLPLERFEVIHPSVLLEMSVALRAQWVEERERRLRKRDRLVTVPALMLAVLAQWLLFMVWYCKF